jgi:carbon monoxide dehydrogenase subunit G
MDLVAELTVPGTPQAVWDRLIDPAVLRRCIPGCTDLDRTSETEFAGRMAVKVGPVSATFTGTVMLEELDEPIRCVLSGQGKGGAAGFVKGSAVITLLGAADGTLLSYVASVQIGGKLAAVGNRLFGSVAKRNIDEFFACLEQVLKDDQLFPS